MERDGLAQTCFLPRRLVKAAYSTAEPTSGSVARSRLYREQTRSARLAGQELRSSHPDICQDHRVTSGRSALSLLRTK